MPRGFTSFPPLSLIHILPDLKDEIEDAEKKVDELLAELNGRKPRKAFGIVPRDW